MIHFYCGSQGVGETLLHAQAVHELAKNDKITLHTLPFRWHGERYQNKENKGPCPVWFFHPSIQTDRIVIEKTIHPNYKIQVRGDEHHSITICRAWGVAVTEPDFYLQHRNQPLLLHTGKNVGVFLRKIDKDTECNYDLFYKLTELLTDNGVTVYQIDGEETILPNARQDFKNIGIVELCERIDSFHCVVGPSSGATHIAKGFNVTCFDIWDWKRFEANTNQVYTMYHYSNQHCYTANGPLLPGTKPASPELLAADIIRMML